MQMKFLSNGKMVTGGQTLSKIVGLRFHEASSTLKIGENVEVKPVEVKGFKNVLGVFNKNGQVGNIISKKTKYIQKSNFCFSWQSTMFYTNRKRVFLQTPKIKVLQLQWKSPISLYCL